MQYKPVGFNPEESDSEEYGLDDETEEPMARHPRQEPESHDKSPPGSDHSPPGEHQRLFVQESKHVSLGQKKRKRAATSVCKRDSGW